MLKLRLCRNSEKKVFGLEAQIEGTCGKHILAHGVIFKGGSLPEENMLTDYREEEYVDMDKLLAVDPCCPICDKTVEKGCTVYQK